MGILSNCHSVAFRGGFWRFGAFDFGGTTRQFYSLYIGFNIFDGVGVFQSNVFWGEEVPKIGVMFMLGEPEIQLAEKIAKENESLLLSELAAVAGCRYYFGGNGIAQLRRLYKPRAYGDVVYSNIRWQGVLVNKPAELAETKLSVAAGRVRGLIWYLVALSPLIEKNKGKRVCTAMIQGWHFDEHPAAKKAEKASGVAHNVPLTVWCSQLQPAPPVYWLGVTDEGQKVEWPNSIKRLRSQHARAAGAAEEAIKAGDGGNEK